MDYIDFVPVKVTIHGESYTVLRDQIKHIYKKIIQSIPEEEKISIATFKKLIAGKEPTIAKKRGWKVTNLSDIRLPEKQVMIWRGSDQDENDMVA